MRLVEESVRVGRGEWEPHSVAEMLGVGAPETVRKRVRAAQAADHAAAVKAVADSEELTRLRAEHPELRRANEIADSTGQRFDRTAPDRLWVAGFTDVSTWSGWVSIAFVLDAYAGGPSAGSVPPR